VPLIENGARFPDGDICKIGGIIRRAGTGTTTGDPVDITGGTVALCIAKCDGGDLVEIEAEIVQGDCGEVCALLDTTLLAGPGDYYYQWAAEYGGQRCSAPCDYGKFTVCESLKGSKP